MDIPLKNVETKGDLSIEVLYDHQFAVSGNSLFHLQVCKFNGNLQYGLCKFFIPKSSGCTTYRTAATLYQNDDAGVKFPTKSNCWMSEQTWKDFLDCVELTADRLAKKDIRMGMNTDIFVNIVNIFIKF